MNQKTGAYLTIVVVGIILSIATAPMAFGMQNNDYKTGVDLFNAGKFKQAYDIFKQVFEAYPGDPELNFYLGRAAFESGDYENAVMAFDRVLIADPTAVRVKLEMARAYQKLGINLVARMYCHEVLQTNPPPSVQGNIEKFLAYMDKTEKRQSINGSISMGLIYDDNVYASPLSRTIETLIGDVTLTGEYAEETSDYIFNTTTDLRHTYKLNRPNTVWKTSAAVYMAKYDDASSLDTLYLAGATGPEWGVGRYTAGIELQANHLSLDGESYQDAYGLSGLLKYQANSRLRVEGNLSYEKKDFETSVRDTDRMALSWNVFFSVSSVWYNVGAAVERWDAKSDEYSFNRYAGKVRIRRQLPYEVIINGNYEFRYSDYDAGSVMFDEGRQDRVHYAGVGIEKRLWQPVSRNSSLVLNLSFLRTIADSSIDLYEYRKNEVFSSLTYRF